MASKYRISNVYYRELLAELLGTFVLVAIGTSVNAFITVAHEGQYGHMIGPWGWGMALTAAIYVCGGVSGGHVNPAVSLAMASVGKLPWRKLPYYFVGQYIGAFLGALCTYCVYYDAIHLKFAELETEGDNATAGIFGTFSQGGISAGTAFVDSTVSCGFFLMIIAAITDKKNMDTSKGLIPIAIGVTDLGLMIFAFGFNAGAPMNPARDIMPRIFSAMAGWGREVFSFNMYNYFWIPMVACHLGSVIGCWIYYIFIEMHWPDKDYEEQFNEDEDIRKRQV